jgi:competence protein ComEC
LLAPHHGSKTSSSQALIEEVEPDIVLFSAAAGNRFGFPAREVLERYVNAGANVLSTSGCGAISIGFSGAGGLEVKTARRARDAIWRWPPEPGCP